MSSRTSHRRASGTARHGGRGRRVPVAPLDFIAWNVITDEGIMSTVHTLGTPPKGYRKATLVE